MRVNDLIAIKPAYIGHGQLDTVNGRDLHAFLEVKDDYSTWVKYQIKRARLVEGRDFVSFQENSGKPKGGRPTTEHAFTLEAGKHIAMLSGTEKGFEVREYFIECEAVAKGAAPYALPATFKEALLQLVTQVEQNEQLQLTISEQAPKVAFADAITESDKDVTFEQFSKVISGKDGGFSIGRNNLFALLREEKLLKDNNLPHQRYIDAGWFKVAEKSYENDFSNGPRTYFKTLLTGRGQVSVFDRLKNSAHLSKYLNKSARCNKPLIGGQGRA